MSNNGQGNLADILATREQAVLDAWSASQADLAALRTDLISETESRKQAGDFLARLRSALEKGGGADLSAAAWEPVRELLSSISRSRAMQGFTPSETATFVFSFKEPIFAALREALADRPDAYATQIVEITRIVDGLGLFTMEAYLRSREEIIKRQQQELLELSTPVIKLWDGVVAVPLIGTLDSARTQVVMENLLQRIVETGARIAIIDITGVPTVDTLVAQHLIKTVAAARLMGADCIISGIRPQIAQTIVHLGVVLENAVTKATLADAISLALRETGFRVTRTQPEG